MDRRFSIHLVTDRHRTRGEPLAAVGAALRGGVDWVQLREKKGPALELYETARALVPWVRNAGAGLLVNDRVDVALASGADGVHLPDKSLPTPAVRELLAYGLLTDGLLGVSVHSLAEAYAAEAGGADYVTFGHVYPTASKPGVPPRGVRELSEIVESVGVPVLAVGGIEAGNVREVLATGASGVAVISTLLAAHDPETAARELRRAVDDSPVRPRRPFPELAKRGAR